MEKRANQLAEIMSKQLDVLCDSPTKEDVLAAREVANQIGKLLKLASLELAYAGLTNRKIPDLPTLERGKGKD